MHVVGSWCTSSSIVFNQRPGHIRQGHSIFSHSNAMAGTTATSTATAKPTSSTAIIAIIAITIVIVVVTCHVAQQKVTERQHLGLVSHAQLSPHVRGDSSGLQRVPTETEMLAQLASTAPAPTSTTTPAHHRDSGRGDL
jgi:hypothetical protein